MQRRNGARVAGLVAVASLVAYSPQVGAQRADDSGWNWADPPASTVDISALDPALQEETRYEPGIAGGLSAILPGAGQFYNDQKTKGILMFGGFATSIAFAFTAGFGQLSKACADGTGVLDSCPDGFSSNAGFWIGLGAATGVYAWSILDAIAVANRSSVPAEGGRRGADLELGPRLEHGTLALAAGIHLRW
ncbi:MAG: hypothetical protein ACREM1_04005 [Longimicrobiales bacterium]